MHCPKCSVNIPNPGTDCPACGVSLRRSCPACNFRNLLSQQFCGQCGADLAAINNSSLIQDTNIATSPANSSIRYPVLSAEIMNLEQLSQKFRDHDQLNRIVRDLMLRLESQLVSQGALIESIRDNIVFFFFSRKNISEQVLPKALKVGIALARKTIQLQDVNLQIRVGIDYVTNSERGPMTAVPERTVAQPGQIVVSETIAQITEKKIPYEAIGPLTVQEKMKTFYRVIFADQPDSSNLAKPVEKSMVEQPKEEPDLLEPLTKEVLNQTSFVTPVKKIEIERKFETPESVQPISYQPPIFITINQTHKKGHLKYQQIVKNLYDDLEAMFSGSSNEIKGKIISICGEEGAGKSTIINMVRTQFPEDSFIWTGGSFFEQYANDRFPLYYWLELIQNLLGIGHEITAKKDAEKHLNQLLSEKLGEQFAKERAYFFKTLLSLQPLEPLSPKIQQRLGRVIPEFLGLFSLLAQSKPVILVMENMEYSDPASIELLIQLIQYNLFQLPICIILTYPPDLIFTGQFHQVTSTLPFKEYVMAPVDEETLISMAEPPLSVPWIKLPDTLRAQLVEKGSPMYLEEAFRWLHSQEAFSINPKTGKLSPEKKIQKLLVPEDIMTVMLERFNLQEEILQRVMQVASVLGERFSTTILGNIISDSGMSEAMEHFQNVLQFLWQNGFIVPEYDSMARFRHHLIWKVAYNSLSNTDRQNLHRTIAGYLEKDYARNMSVNPVQIAFHMEAAGDIEQSANYWIQTLVWLANTGTVTGANQAYYHLQNIMSLAGISHSESFQKKLYGGLGIINIDANPMYAKNLFLSAMQIPSEEDLFDYIQMRLLLAQTYDRLGAYSYSVTILHNLLGVIPDDEKLVVAKLMICAEEIWYLYLQGSYQEALIVYEEEIKPYGTLFKEDFKGWEDAEFRTSYLKSELARSRIALMQCRQEAFDIIDEALIRCEVFKEQALALQFRMTRGWGFLLKGDYSSCQREMEPMLTDIESLSQPAEVMTWWGLIVLLYHCEMGDWQNALMLLPNTVYQAEQIRDYLAWCLCQAIAGKIKSETGSPGEAQKLLEQAITVSSEYHLAQPALMGWRFIAENELLRSNKEVALQICLRAIEVAQKHNIQNLYELYQLTVVQARILIADGKLKEAGTLLEGYWPDFVKSGYTPLVAEAAFQISELYSNLLHEVPEQYQAKYRQKQDSFLQKARTLWQEQGNSYKLGLLIKKQQQSISVS